jgi:hypothetical protein
MYLTMLYHNWYSHFINGNARILFRMNTKVNASQEITSTPDFGDITFLTYLTQTDTRQSAGTAPCATDMGGQCLPFRTARVLLPFLAQSRDRHTTIPLIFNRSMTSKCENITAHQKQKTADVKPLLHIRSIKPQM